LPQRQAPQNLALMRKNPEKVVGMDETKIILEIFTDYV
jgi:hypothetical protein